jgi:hypothetical protein
MNPYTGSFIILRLLVLYVTFHEISLQKYEIVLHCNTRCLITGASVRDITAMFNRLQEAVPAGNPAGSRLECRDPEMAMIPWLGVSGIFHAWFRLFLKIGDRGPTESA